MLAAIITVTFFSSPPLRYQVKGSAIPIPSSKKRSSGWRRVSLAENESLSAKRPENAGIANPFATWSVAIWSLSLASVPPLKRLEVTRHRRKDTPIKGECTQKMRENAQYCRYTLLFLSSILSFLFCPFLPPFFLENRSHTCGHINPTLQLFDGVRSCRPSSSSGDHRPLREGSGSTRIERSWSLQSPGKRSRRQGPAAEVPQRQRDAQSGENRRHQRRMLASQALS